jgi:hypothetical protein
MVSQVPIIILISLIGLVLVILALKTSHQVASEGFLSEQNAITFCPMGASPYFDKAGDTLCCDGKVKGNICSGTTLCALSTNHPTAPSCVSVLQKYASQKAKNVCPPSMSSYFEDPNTHVAGCTTGPLSHNMTSPAVPAQPTCTIYSDNTLNRSAPNSCHNQRLLENTKCFGGDCVKNIMPQKAAGVCLISTEFSDTNGHRHVCYSRESYVDYLNQTKPGWQATFDPSKNIRICEVAKKVYVDRTMDTKDAQL